MQNQFGASIQLTRIVYMVALILLIAVVAYLSIASPSASRTRTSSSSTTLSYSTLGPNVVANGGFENGLGPWEVAGLNQTVLLSRDSPHGGLTSLELITEQGPNPNSTGVSVLQWFPNGGCKAFPALAMGTDFRLSLWHRTLNVSQIRYSVTVVFHNGTSKLAINYLLAWKGPVPVSSVASDLSGGNDYIAIDDSSSSWTQASLDLRADFIRYYHFDPVARGYCINYISLGQTSLSASIDVIMPTSYTTGTRSYCFFDDVELVPVV